MVFNEDEKFEGNEEEPHMRYDFVHHHHEHQHKVNGYLEQHCSRNRDERIVLKEEQLMSRNMWFVSSEQIQMSFCLIPKVATSTWIHHLLSMSGTTILTSSRQ